MKYFSTLRLLDGKNAIVHFRSIKSGVSSALSFKDRILTRFQTYERYAFPRFADVSVKNYANENVAVGELSNDETVKYVVAIIFSNGAVRSLDELLCSRFPRFSIADSLKVLSALGCASYPITNLKFHDYFINQTSAWLKLEHDVDPFHLVQAVYFVSLAKKIPRSKEVVISALEKIEGNTEKYFNQLMLEDLGILCNSTFRTSTKMKSEKILNLLVDKIEKDIKQLLADGAIFASLIKPLKFAKYHSKRLLKCVSDETMIHDCFSALGLQTKIHLISLYVDSLHNDTKFVETLLKSLEDDITNTSFIALRTKDLCSFLWAASYLRLHVTNKDLVERIITEKFVNSLKKSVTDKLKKEFIDSLLSMWILDWKPYKLVKTYITEKPYNFWEVRGNVKHIARFDLLITCLSIEAPHMITGDHLKQRNPKIAPNIAKHISARYFFQRVYNTVLSLRQNLQLRQVSCVYNIPYLWICAVSVINKNRQLIYIEVLDNSTCLQETNTPHGLMSLKLRLLSTLGHKCIIMDYMDPELKEMENVYHFVSEALK